MQAQPFFRFPLPVFVLALISVGVAVFGADWIYGFQDWFKGFLTAVVFLIPLKLESNARSRFLDKGKQVGEDTALLEPNEARGAPERTADSRALLLYMAKTVFGAVAVVFLLVVLWIQGAVAQLALYQLLASIAMLSSIVIGVVHLTYARKQLHEAERQRRGVAELSRVLGQLEDTMKGLDGKGVLSLQRNLNRLFWSIVAACAVSAFILAVLVAIWFQMPEPTDTGGTGTQDGADQSLAMPNEVFETDSVLMVDDSVGATSASVQPRME